MDFPLVSPLRLLRVLVAVSLGTACTGSHAAEPESEFSRTSIDIAIVVSDIEQSLNFYTEGLGFQEGEGYAIPAELADRLGLADREELYVHVLLPEKENTASRIKVIAAPASDAQVLEKTSIPTIAGFRYITIFVADIDGAADRLRAVGVPATESAPVALARGSLNEVFIMLVSDPDGNRIEIVGPRESTE
jgi:catechol 2,3-dioxygenase-like lactoylglutathione lyase family enzyme